MLRTLALLAIVLSSLGASAGEPSQPAEELYGSSNGQWRLVVAPKVFANPSSPGSTGRAVLARLSTAGAWQAVARWNLVDEPSSVHPLVANDGTVVTFDDWHERGAGYGDPVIVIYRPDGTLLRKLALSDFIDAGEASQLDVGLTAIWWWGKHRIDERTHTVVVQIDTREVQEVAVDLTTGRITGSQRSRVRVPRVTWRPENRVHERLSDGTYVLSPDDLTALAIYSCTPEYSVLARKTRMHGDVIVEFHLGADGSLTHSQVVKPLPMGLDQAAEEALRQWRFRPLVRDAKAVPAFGVVRFSFERP